MRAQSFVQVRRGRRPNSALESVTLLDYSGSWNSEAPARFLNQGHPGRAKRLLFGLRYLSSEGRLLGPIEAVGHSFAVNPDKELRKAALAHDWPVLVFTQPVALRARVPLPPARPTLAALAVGGVVAVGGVIWANARKRRLGA